MKRILLLVFLGLFTATLAFATQPQSLIQLPAGKSPEGIAVNPITHKAYVATEDDATNQKVILVFNNAALNGTSAPKLVPIANETEYITVDPVRNRIYLSTKYGVKTQDVEDGDDESGGEGDSGSADDSGGTETTTILGTLTVIDGRTDTVVATYQFAEGVEPEGVAVDLLRNIVYVGTKVPEPEPSNGSCPWGTYFIDEDGDEECWTAGSIVAFRAANITAGPIKIIPAGDDPESVVFGNNMIYAANEDDGTVTVARAVTGNGGGGGLITDTPVYSPTYPPYSLGVFYGYGPNTLACPDKQYETDKMAVDLFGSVYITDDKSRVAKIRNAEVVAETTVPIDPLLGQCDLAKGNDENGLNTANNIAFMLTNRGPAIYVVSEQNTVAVLDPQTLALKTTITVPNAVHLDAIGVDVFANRVWITDEVLSVVFVLQGPCANGTGPCVQ